MAASTFDTLLEVELPQKVPAPTSAPARATNQVWTLVHREVVWEDGLPAGLVPVADPGRVYGPMMLIAVSREDAARAAAVIGLEHAQPLALGSYMFVGLLSDLFFCGATHVVQYAPARPDPFLVATMAEVLATFAASHFAKPNSQGAAPVVAAG